MFTVKQLNIETERVQPSRTPITDKRMKSREKDNSPLENENVPSSHVFEDSSYSKHAAEIQKELSNFVVLYKFLSGDEFEATLSKWALKGTLLYEASDPLEMIPQANGPNGLIIDFLNSPEYDSRPFISFSRVISSPTMWGHYADSGKGVCLVFLLPVGESVSEQWHFNTPHNDLSYVASHKAGSAKLGYRLIVPEKIKSTSSADATNSSYLLPIRYMKDRVLGITAFAKNQATNIDDFNEQEWIEHLISTKSDSWQYEQELRLICNPKFATKIEKNEILYEWPLTYLVGVVAGPRYPYSDSILEQKLSLSYNRVRERLPNYFCSNMEWLNSGNFIVSRAKYHWSRFEVEAAPWSDRQEGWGVMFDILLNQVYQHTTPEELGLAIDSWNDFQEAISINGNKKLLATPLQNLPEHLRSLAKELNGNTMFFPARTLGSVSLHSRTSVSYYNFDCSSNNDEPICE